MKGFPNMFGQGSFLVDPNSTPDMLARKREALANMVAGYGNEQYISTGIIDLIGGLMAGKRNRAMDRFEGDRTANASAQFNALMGGGGGREMQPQGVAMPQSGDITSGPIPPGQGIAADTMSILGYTPRTTASSMSAPAGGAAAYRDRVARVESGGDYGALGPVTERGDRAYGKYQVRGANIGPWTQKHLGRAMTPQEFLADQSAQDAVFDAEFGSYLTSTGSPQDAVSMWFSGLPLADAGNRSDGYNTVPQYVEKVLGGGGTSPSQAQGAPDTAALMEAMANPWLSQEQKAMIGAMLGQTQQQADPLYQATLAEKQAQAAAGQADPTSGLPAGYRELLLRADAAGLGAGTTDYQQFMLNGGPDPSSFRTLEAQALAGGLVPGSAEFMTFMATRGAGPAAQAGAEGKAAGEARASANSLTAKLPGLNSVIDQLDALAEQATYTGVGRALNWAGKELGLPPGDASIAREQYIAMVNNQVLPLLVDTFGSQFTVVEGESLRKTLGDPNQPPAVKQVILRAFIEQKTRDAQALQDQADMGPGGQPPPSGAGPASRTWNPETGAFE